MAEHRSAENSISSRADNGLWGEAVAQLQSGLEPEVYNRLRRITSMEDLLSHVNTLSERYKKRLVTRALGKLEAFFVEISRFERVVSIFIQADPTISALVWGSICLVLEIASRHGGYLQSIVDMFDLTQKHMPRIRSYAELFTNANNIERAVVGLYRNLIGFSLGAVRFLRRNPIANLLNPTFPYKSFHSSFAKTLDSIREHTQWIDVEAFVTFHLREMNQSVKRHEEILAALSADARDSRRPSIATTTAPGQKATYQLLGWLENPLFFGRDGDLEAISHELIESTDKPLRIFGLVGIAGAGKSQLALRFVYKYREQLDGIFWIPADEPTKLARGFEDIARELHLIDDGTDVASEIVRRRVLGWFRTTTQSWLLVLDNVRDIHILHNYWPVGGKGRIILTSQNLTAMAQPVTVSKLIEPFNPEDGAAAFLSFLPANVRGEPDAWGNACIISNACGGLPLALHQCARFLKVSNMSIGELSRICSETASLVQPHSLLNTIPGKDYYYSGNLSTIWQRPLADLSKTPSFVLKILSWLDPDSIPEVLIKSPRQLHEGMREYLSSEAESVNPACQRYTTNKRSYYLAIKSLQEHGLVNKSTCSGVFIMHRLIQAMVIQSMSTEDRRIAFKLTLTLLDAAIPLQENWEQQTGNWDQFGRALPHIQRLESLRRELNIELSPALAHQLGSVLERTGWYLYERGLLDHSLDLLSKAESVAKYAAASLNIDHVVMESLNTLIYDVINDKACIKFAECRFGEAKDLYSKCLALKEATESPSQNELCLLTNNIGNALANMGLLDEAYTWLKKSFDMRQELLALAPEPGIYKDQLARDWGTLAGCLWLMGNYSTAWEYANYSTKLCEEIYPKDDLVLAGCYVVLGNIRKSQKKLEEAKQLQLKSLDIYTQKYSSHYDTALAYHRYGKLLCEEGNVLDAIDYLKRAIRILSDNPHFKAANARSHYYLAELSDSLLSGDGTQDRERAISLYSEQVRISLEEARGIGLTMKDFDRLISCWQW